LKDGASSQKQQTKLPFSLLLLARYATAAKERKSQMSEKTELATGRSPHLKGGCKIQSKYFSGLWIRKSFLLILSVFVLSNCSLGTKALPKTPQPSKQAPSATLSATELKTLVEPPVPETPGGPTAGSPTAYLPIVPNGSRKGPQGSDWPTVGANAERTSWSTEEITGDLHVEWYRPIEAYISQNTQIIAGSGLLYISTSRGLYALNAATGQEVWRFNTELPLGNSPTVSGGIVYVGGFDHKIHALQASNGTHLWAFDGAQAGFSTNPLVAEGRVIAGTATAMYAIGAQDPTRVLYEIPDGRADPAFCRLQRWIVFCF
jgi:hypothetical protein